MDVATRMRRVRALVAGTVLLFVGVAFGLGDVEDGVVAAVATVAVVLLPLAVANAVSLMAERRGWGPRSIDAELALDGVCALLTVQLSAGVAPIVLVPPIIVLVVFEAAARRHAAGGFVTGLALGGTLAALRLLEFPPEAVPPRFGWTNVLTMVVVVPFGGWVLGATFASRDRAADALRAANAELGSLTGELQATNDQLGRVNRELELFSSVVAHDLKSPIGSMMGFAHLAARQDLPAPADQYVERVIESGERAVRMIDGMLQHAHTVAAAATLGDVDLDEVVGAIVDDLADEIAARDAHVEVLPLGTVRSDRVLLRVALQNLLVNALRYHAAGEAPRVRVSATANPAGTTTVTVEDAGIGIPEEDRKHVFELGARLRVTDVEGTGLGLATTRTLVERLEGTVFVTESSLGGAAFAVTLPDAGARADRSSRAVPPAPADAPPTVADRDAPAAAGAEEQAALQ
jgi:signal transduction histidine kinase